MRLRKIRLAGFKSFVDPTSIAFPGELIGVVGPNGCGKSNIIDAVRWVMGEVSAKHLRGGTMADVVFTGSNTRKPVGQASVELVFDNSEGRLEGQFASYSEISVRRQIARDSQSSYFLNGTRCRRRDVMDVFLGTGLGPRSYAIIEQGMISRVIEARPEDLREFIEEAAGISKYRERRRETENRIRHTRENLDRLSDLREELGKRLTHLKRQATQAERYKTHKAEERELEGQLLALRWRTLDVGVTSNEQQVREQETRLDAAVADQRRAESGLERARNEHTEASDRFNAEYREVLGVGAEIARGEEAIQGLCERQGSLDDSISREVTALESARRHQSDEDRQLVELREELGELEPALARAQQRASESRLALRQNEEAMHAWQAEWESITERAAEPARIAHAEEARIQHLEENRGRLEARLESLRDEASGLRPDELREDIASFEARLDEDEEALRATEDEVDEARERIGEERTAKDELASALHHRRERLQEVRGRLASLQALQQDALGKTAEAAVGWLRDQALDARPRLAETIDVDSGWETAVELALGNRLEAVCVDDIERPAQALAELSDGSLMLFAGRGESESLPGRLSAKVRAPWSLDSLLSGIHVADDLAGALARRGSLGPGESVITRGGLWLGRDWIRVARGTDDAGVITRERELKQLADEHDGLAESIAKLDEDLEASGRRLEAVERAHAEAQARVGDAHRAVGERKSELRGAEARLEQVQARLAAVSAETIDLDGRLAAEQNLIATARTRLERTAEEMARIGEEREAWSHQRDLHRQRLDEAGERWQAARDAAYETGLKAESARARIDSLERGRSRNRDQVLAHERRSQELREVLESTRGPLREAQAGLSEKLGIRSELERGLTATREAVESAEGRVRVLEQERGSGESRASEERTRLEALRMEARDAAVRRKTVEERFAEGDRGTLAEVLAEVPEEADEATWEERLSTVERRISRLGPINLAAIDEHKQVAERKEYLDAQQADLEEALQTLTDAIGRIDRETRARFKETYERVNAGLGEMFPKLFGGGEAKLELTGDDLLSTGISVIARPPGKRNASIHLLSGGEKALSAVALVFAIFELNPAPFCLLDEVDAPLDDANVGRFCNLVKEMSERVQFVVVTHNKITMEIAQQLIGVTMNEPGVSRLVAVDLDEAVEMAAE